MKKYLIIFLTFIILSGVVSAQSSLSDAGLLPDSPFYFLKSWKESIQLFFTFNAENKAKQYLHLAEVRLAEYEKLIAKGKSQIAEKTLEKYQNQLNHALQKAEEIKQKGKDIKDLSQQIKQVQSLQSQFFLENIPEQAKQEAREKARKIMEKENMAKEAIAQMLLFCNNKRNGSFYANEVFVLNFDADSDKEIMGICWKSSIPDITDSPDKEGLLLVLDKQNNEYQFILEKKDSESQRYTTFKNLEIKDIDGDGIDEILYKARGWSAFDDNDFLYLYTPKYKEWFWRNKWKVGKLENDKPSETTGIDYSLNLNSEKYKVFKELLMQ